jgi:hypothetical protein
MLRPSPGRKAFVQIYRVALHALAVALFRTGQRNRAEQVVKEMLTISIVHIARRGLSTGGRVKWLDDGPPGRFRLFVPLVSYPFLPARFQEEGRALRQW